VRDDGDLGDTATVEPPTIPVWQRFPAAQEWINRHPKTVAAMRATPVIEQTAHAVPSTPAEQERLFQEFLKWAREHRQ
jgi:hypothetical protein